MSLTKEAIEYIKNLGTTADKMRIITNDDGQQFLISGSTIEPYIPNDQPRTIDVNTLSAIVQYVNSQFDENKCLYIHVKTPTMVEVFSPLDEYGRRAKLMTAETPIREPEFGRYKSTEVMNVEMQSQFEKNTDSDIILKVIGNLTEENVRNATDDGVTQAVTVKTGVANVENVKVPNPVKLQPYRTFPEVKQPESLFIFRMKEGMQCALFEVTNGAWIIEAIHSIEKYFEDELSVEIKNGKIKILA